MPVGAFYIYNTITYITLLVAQMISFINSNQIKTTHEFISLSRNID